MLSSKNLECLHSTFRDMQIINQFFLKVKNLFQISVFIRLWINGVYYSNKFGKNLKDTKNQNSKLPLSGGGSSNPFYNLICLKYLHLKNPISVINFHISRIF